MVGSFMMTGEHMMMCDEDMDMIVDKKDDFGR